MTYVVTDLCINCIYTDCVEVCPVDCFFEGENMLVIDPEICIDCGVCVPECPADAIIADTEDPTGEWVAFNQKYAQIWPVITQVKPHRPDAKKWEDVDNKMQYFIDAPGKTPQ